MIEITAEIRALIDKAAAGVELAEDEYIDLSDGLIHCKKCGGQRQTVVPCFGKPGYFMPRCICQCQREAEEQRKAAEERQRRMERIKRRKAQGLQDRYLYDYTFANDNGQNPLMEKEVFAEHLRQSPDFELLWSDKVGYVWLAIGVNPVYVDTGIRIESAADLCGRCLDDVAMDVLYMTGNDHALEAADPLELAEIKRRWEPYINQLPDYAYLCKDLLNGKM